MDAVPKRDAASARAKLADDADGATRFVISVVRQSGNWSACEPLEDACRAIAALAAHWPNLDVPDGSELVVAFGCDADVADLNGRFRDKPQPTNVLSFPAARDSERHVRNQAIGGSDLEPVSIGDVILASETLLREADAKGLAPADHMQHLVIHGLLHCLGFDHADDEQAAIMEALEVAMLDRLGIANPYLEAADVQSGAVKP